MSRHSSFGVGLQGPSLSHELQDEHKVRTSVVDSFLRGDVKTLRVELNRFGIPSKDDLPRTDLYRSFLDLLSIGDLAGSLDLAKRLALSEPLDSRSLDLIAKTLIAQGAGEEALFCLARIAAVSDLAREQWLGIAMDLAKSGAVSAASKLLHSILDRENEDISALLTGSLIYSVIEEHLSALKLLVKAANLDKSSPNIMIRLAEVCMSCDKLPEAKRFAYKAWELARGLVSGRLLAHVMMELKEYQEAVGFLRILLNDGFDDPSIYFMLSVGLSQQGKMQEALDVFSGYAPNNIVEEAHILMQIGVLQSCLGYYDESIETFSKILEAIPGHPDATKSRFLALAQAGRFTEAVSDGAKVVASLPDDVDLGRTLNHVLSRRLDTVVHDGFLNGEMSFAELKRARLNDGQYPRPTMAPKKSGLVVQARVVSALFLRDLVGRFGRTRLGYVWALFEPLAHISIMVFLINSFSHGSPPMGASFAVFYFTGIIPYHLFTHTASNVMVSIPTNRPILQLPIVTTLDVFLARGFLEFMTELSVAGILFLAFLCFGLDALPLNAFGVISTLFQLWIIALSIGIINAVIRGFVKSWESIWGALMSVLYFSSGTFYVPQIMPVEVRSILSWNPVLQAIELVRSSYFHVPPHPWVSQTYFTAFAIMSLGIGLLFQQVFRKEMTRPE